MNSHGRFDSPAPGRADEGEKGLAQAVRPPARILDSGTLFHGSHEIGIEHHGALYRLKITRQGKLILNK